MGCLICGVDKSCTVLKVSSDLPWTDLLQFFVRFTMLQAQLRWSWLLNIERLVVTGRIERGASYVQMIVYLEVPFISLSFFSCQDWLQLNVIDVSMTSFLYVVSGVSWNSQARFKFDLTNETSIWLTAVTYLRHTPQLTCQYTHDPHQPVQTILGAVRAAGCKCVWWWIVLYWCVIVRCFTVFLQWMRQGLCVQPSFSQA